MTSGLLYGPTYAEMRDATLLETELRTQAAGLQVSAPHHFLNLYNIRWHDAAGRIDPLVIPKEISGVDAHIVVLDGGRFPSGSMKVGPAYAMLMEKEIRDGLRPGQARIIGPSTGNFGIGTAFVSRLKGYEARIVMPEGMSRERYELIRTHGGTTDLTPGTESDVLLTLEHTRERYGPRADCAILGQFEDMANYRFHRHVTGRAIQDGLAELGLAQADAFVSAPGSAGTLAAGDALRTQWPDVVIAAVEPQECSTLFDGSGGQHVIEGIGDQMVTLIHNVFATDLVVRVPGARTLHGMELLRTSLDRLMAVTGMHEKDARRLQGRFGPSGICNLLGAIRVAKYLGFTAAHTVVTIATDSYDRYGSVSQALAAELGREPNRNDLRAWHEAILNLEKEVDVLSLHDPGQHKRLHAMKKTAWTHLGVAPAYIDRMQDATFWEEAYVQIPALDQRWQELRAVPHPGLDGPGSQYEAQ